MSKEAMKLALEALENSIDLVSHEARNAEELYGKYPTRLARIQGLVAFEVAHEKAIAALRQALANEALDKKAENARELGLDYEPAQQEPVVWMYVNKSTHETKFQKHMRDFVDHSLWSEVPLYGEPLANHELQCICGAIWLGDEMVHLPDKRLPPQRTWVGLVWGELPEDGHNHDYLRGAVWAEAKLREKNT